MTGGWGLSGAVEGGGGPVRGGAVFAVLREHNVAHVFNSWTRMPPIGEQLDIPGSLSAPFTVARRPFRIDSVEA